MKIVLLPGLDGTGDLFDGFVSRKPDHWSAQVVRYPRNQILDYDDCCEIARGLLPTDERFILLGESFSGPIAIILASRGPANLAGLVLCSTFARRPWWSGFGTLPWTRIFSRPIPSIVMRRMGAGRDQPSLRALLRSTVSSVEPRVLAGRLREVLSVDVTEALTAVRVPMLYLRGAFDTTVRRRCLRYILYKRPDVVVAELPVSHLLLQLAPAQAWAAIDSFMAERCVGEGVTKVLVPPG